MIEALSLMKSGLGKLSRQIRIIIGNLCQTVMFPDCISTIPSPQTNEAFHLPFIEQQFRSGDFVVIKLDIDNEHLENNVMNEIMNIRQYGGRAVFREAF